MLGSVDFFIQIVIFFVVVVHCVTGDSLLYIGHFFYCLWRLWGMLKIYLSFLKKYVQFYQACLGLVWCGFNTSYIFREFALLFLFALMSLGLLLGWSPLLLHEWMEEVFPGRAVEHLPVALESLRAAGTCSFWGHVLTVAGFLLLVLPASLHIPWEK